jgi:acetoin utilization deacetylase AcuC-like enzyme
VTVWNDRYCTDAAYTNSTSKQAEVVRLAKAEGLVATQTVPFDAQEAWTSIATVHDPAYVEAVRTGKPRGLAESQGFRWSPEFAESVARIWSGHMTACQMARHDGMVLHPVSGAHHADYHRGAAYCTFNYLVGAARQMANDTGHSVAIIDLDAHPGDGTFRLASDEAAIALFDIAGGRWFDAPRTDRIEYHDAGDAEEYRTALDRLPAFLDRVQPGFVQYQAGMDLFEDDPVGGVRGITAAFLEARDRFVIEAVRSRGIPLVVNLAGGYVTGVSERLHVTTIRAMAAWQQTERSSASTTERGAGSAPSSAIEAQAIRSAFSTAAGARSMTCR